jgi:protein-S-isoprenylcysteine O-methyltransferase Ste14
VRKPAAAVTSVAFFALAPGVVAGFIPWYVTNGWTRNDPRYGWLLALPGVALVIAGVAVLVHAFVHYVKEGFGTPAPIAPTERLVVGGLNRYVRNPMYLAVVATIVGQALLLARPVLLTYAAIAFATMAAFTRWYEEPTLAQRFGSEYEAYCNEVPRWLPRVRRIRRTYDSGSGP